MDDVSEWVLSHHERPDGTGYPSGLSGTDIPFEARILAVADAYEAMTTDRIYRSAMPEEDARAELVRCAGTQFDRRVVDAFLRVLDTAPSAGRLRLVR
jgi:HD-GYP domain-containing protein (c-di-GMP phosphodiesterase class II)